MTRAKTRLELTWIGKEHPPKLEPRILVSQPRLSYHTPRPVSCADILDSLLTHGGNLLTPSAEGGVSGASTQRSVS